MARSSVATIAQPFFVLQGGSPAPAVKTSFAAKTCDFAAKEVGGEISSKRRRVEIDAFAVGGFLDTHCRLRLRTGKRCQILALVRLEGGDVDHSFDLPVMAGFADHHAALAVPDEQGRSVLQVQNTVRSLDVGRKRGQRFLHHRYVETAPRRDIAGLPPARTVGKGAVHDDDVLDVRSLGGEGDNARGKCKSNGWEWRMRSFLCGS